MVWSTRSSTIFLFLSISTILAYPWEFEKVSKPLDGSVDNDSHGPSDFEESEDPEDIEPSIWMDYEFNTGAGNREELIVTDISVYDNANLPETAGNWQYLDVNGTSWLFRTENSTLRFHKFDPDNVEIADSTRFDPEGDILTFKVIAIHRGVNVVAVLCVETASGVSLRWYRLVNGESFQWFWSWPVQKRIKDIMFIQHDEPNKLLLLNEDEMYFNLRYSPIDVYGFSIDFSSNAFHFWLCERTLMPRAFNVEVCSIYESVSLALQIVSGVVFYEYRNTTEGSIFREMQTLKSHNLNNFVCFESGYLQFLAISGQEAALFHYENDEFIFNVKSESNFDHTEISWVKDIKLNTYRDESLLLIQLKNSSVIALAWQGLSFMKTELPGNILDKFDLSTITPLPKFGFVFGNRFVKFRTRLKHVKHPIQRDTERLLVLQRLLNDSFHGQEKILKEANEVYERIYLQDPLVTGVWNMSAVNAKEAVISDDVNFESITIGSVKLTKEELELDVNELEKALNDLQRKLHEIDDNLRNALESNTTELRFDSDIEIFGNVNVTGTLTVENLIVESINDVDITQSSTINGEHHGNEDKWIFDSIEADNLTISYLNGVPIENIRFSDSIVNYTDVDFSKINQAHVHGHLSFDTINGVDWEDLMKNLVWKDKPMVIPGNTVIEGTVIANNVELNTLNDLWYPEDYITTTGDSTVIVTGSKSFDTLVTPRLENVATLNGIDFEDFVILNKDNVLKEEITFENLTVEGPFQLDGKITGLNLKERRLINESSNIPSDVTFLNLHVLGNVTFDNLLMSKRPLDLGDLLLRNEENVEITGKKTFLGNVEMRSNVTITSGMINGHSMDEFATVDTDQVFPNLIKISSNVSFGNVTFGAIKKLEDYLEKNANFDNCLEKIVVFTSPITVDELSFDSLNSNVSYKDFTRKLNETFRNVTFDNLIVDNLLAEEIAVQTVNGVDFANFTERMQSSNNSDEYVVDNLEMDQLNVSFVNGMSVYEINRSMDKMRTILDSIRNGSVKLDSLRVRGTIQANSINGQPLADFYEKNQSVTMVFKEDVYIKNLTILGLMNGYNFSDRVSDTVLKTDTNITIDGYKTFDNINCYSLNVNSLNGHPIENLLDPLKEQVLSGPVTINGIMTILNSVNASGKIGDVPYHDLMNRFKVLGNDTFEYHGDVRLPDNVTIQNLYTNGSIQGRNFERFLKSVIFIVEDNVTISGRKVFENSVTFNDAFVVRDYLNDIDLKRFEEKVVSINEPFSIESKIRFKDGIEVEADLTIQSDLDTKSIMGIDVNELQYDVFYLNRPSFVEKMTIFGDVSFLSNIEVEIFNDLDMNLLIPLHTEQIIPVDALKCINVTVDKLDILGLVNGEDLGKIKENTFMLTGDQNITGNFTFLGDVVFRRDFNPRRLNGIDPTKFISLHSKDPIIGNFFFEKPVYFNQSLRVLGYVNDIDPTRWEAVAVTANNSLQQIVCGGWTVHGNVYFENGAYGSDMLNGTNVTETSNILARNRLEMEAVLAEKDANLDSMCEDMKYLKHCAEKQIYQFNTFDYLQVIDFPYTVSSVHYFQLDDLDYLMISFKGDTCNMYTYLFTGTKFELVANVSDFGAVEEWTTFEHDRLLYFLTSGPSSCGRSPMNLWKLQNDTFEHVLDLGRNMDDEKISRDTLTLLGDQFRSVEGINEIPQRPYSSLTNDLDDVKIVLEEDQMLLTNKHANYRYNVDRSNNSSQGKYGRDSEKLNFKAGLLEKKLFLYYDKDVSKDRIFICENGATQKKIVQTIKAHRPTSFAILNFGGSIETFLIFVENKNHILIYEYKGIQGFVYKDSIKMSVDKLISFKFRKYTDMARRYCLALIHDNRLSILEAKMYGEKLDMGTLNCAKR